MAKPWCRYKKRWVVAITLAAASIFGCGLGKTTPAGAGAGECILASNYSRDTQASYDTYDYLSTRLFDEEMLQEGSFTRTYIRAVALGRPGGGQLAVRFATNCDAAAEFVTRRIDGISAQVRGVAIRDELESINGGWREITSAQYEQGDW